MISVDLLATFFMASVLLALAPGPDNIFVLTRRYFYRCHAHCVRWHRTCVRYTGSLATPFTKGANCDESHGSYDFRRFGPETRYGRALTLAICRTLPGCGKLRHRSGHGSASASRHYGGGQRLEPCISRYHGVVPGHDGPLGSGSPRLSIDQDRADLRGLFHVRVGNGRTLSLIVDGRAGLLASLVNSVPVSGLDCASSGLTPDT